MQHLDPDSISMAALGEQLHAAAEEHLAACASCAAEVADLGAVVVAARSGSLGADLEAPGPEVWAGVHRELGLDPSLVTDPLEGPPLRAGSHGSSDSTGAAGSTDSSVRGAGRPEGRAADPAGRAGPPRPAVVPFRERGRRRPGVGGRYLAAAAAAGIVVGGGAMWAVQALDPDVSPRVIAQTDLEPLEGSTVEGSATVVTSGDGSRSLDVALNEGRADGYQEVWLIAPDLGAMYSLGVLHEGAGSLAIPDSVDLGGFPIVDVSDEPLDGDPVHSGVSLARGSLSATTG